MLRLARGSSCQALQLATIGYNWLENLIARHYDWSEDPLARRHDWPEDHLARRYNWLEDRVAKGIQSSFLCAHH